jgi:hypothetical protein
MFPLLSLEEQISVFSNSLSKIKEQEKLLTNMLQENSDFPINVTGLFKHPMMILKTNIEFFEWVIKKIVEDNSSVKKSNKRERG